jgi:hypothetical protein
MGDLKELADDAAYRFGGDHHQAGRRGRGGACSNVARSDHSGLGTLWGQSRTQTSTASHTGTRHCVECLEIRAQVTGEDPPREHRHLVLVR